MIIRLLAVFLMIFLVGCSSAQSIDTIKFHELWVAARNDSAVSWWYYGEDLESYYLIQQYPFHNNHYKVPKGGLKLKGVPPMEHGSLIEPVNLNADNVVFTENVL
jgi:hypothetical protein